MLGVALVALVAAIALYFIGQRLPIWVFQLISPFGSLMILGIMFWGGQYAYAYALLFVWAALYSFSFFSGAAATAQGFCIAAFAGAYLFGFAHPANAPGYWLMIAGTGAVAGVLIQRLLRQVEALAHIDSLTGAFNRRTWDAEVPKAITRAGRSRHALSIAIADFDHFKVFNDEYGHQAGDRVLAEVVTLWRAVLRAGDTLARYGGEEFAVVLEGCDAVTATSVVEKMRAAMPLGRTCSIGIAEWDGDESPQSLVERADAALYEAKRLGRDRAIAAPSRAGATGGNLGDTARWAEVLYGVFADHPAGGPAAIGTAFQPILNLGTGQVIGMEALARPPGAAAEESVEGLFYTAQRLGLIRELDWACRRAALRAAVALPESVPLFLNISLASLLDPVHDVDQFLLILRSVGRRPESVVLELTERESVIDPNRLMQVLAIYREEGFRFAIDDLGEGRAEMEVLAFAVPEFVKVTRRLVHDDHIGARSLVAATVAFARSSNGEVVAEGIETVEDVDRVRAAGITCGQGYLFGHPTYEIDLAAGRRRPVPGAPHRGAWFRLSRPTSSPASPSRTSAVAPVSHPSRSSPMRAVDVPGPPLAETGGR